MEKCKETIYYKGKQYINDASIEEDPKALGDIIYMQNLLILGKSSIIGQTL